MKKGFGKGNTRCRRGWKAAVFAVMLCAAFMLPGTGIFASAANATEIAPAVLAAAALQDTAVYALPEDASAVVGTAAAGQALNICGKTADGWYETVFGNTIGYVKSSAVAEIAVDSAMAEALAQQAQFVKAQLQAQEAGQAQTPAGQQSEAALQEQQAAGQTPLPAQPEAGQPPLSAGNLIFVGDSRTGQMGNAVGGSAMHPGTAFVACFGGGVDWLSGQKAKQDIDRFVTPGSVIILNYGVNDLSRHNDYIPLINRYAQDWRKKGASVYFASVGPVGENAYGKRNWAVEYFNGQLGGRLDQGIGRIDLYGYLTAAGYETLPDGLHYTPDTYARMFQFLCQSVGR